MPELLHSPLCCTKSTEELWGVYTPDISVAVPIFCQVHLLHVWQVNYFVSLSNFIKDDLLKDKSTRTVLHCGPRQSAMGLLITLWGCGIDSFTKWSNKRLEVTSLRCRLRLTSVSSSSFHTSLRHGGCTLHPGRFPLLFPKGWGHCRLKRLSTPGMRCHMVKRRREMESLTSDNTN